MSHAYNKRDRQEQLLLKLVNAITDGVNPEEIAIQLECNPSTIYRDLDELCQLHPIDKIERGRYRLDRKHFISNVMLNATEAMVIYLALRRYLRQTSHAPEFIVTAMRKVSTAINHIELADQLEMSTRLLEDERPTKAIYTDIWQKIFTGWLERRVVEIAYTKPGQSQPTSHLIEPYLFEPAVLSHGTYVIAYSRAREDLRIFKMSRIQSARITLATFEPRIDFDVNTLLKHAWGIWFGQTVTKIELMFAPEVANRVLETRRHPSEDYTWQPDGSLYWSVEVAGYKELLPWIRGWGSQVEVLAPPHLREEIVKDLRKAVSIYE